SLATPFVGACPAWEDGDRLPRPSVPYEALTRWFGLREIRGFVVIGNQLAQRMRYLLSRGGKCKLQIANCKLPIVERKRQKMLEAGVPLREFRPLAQSGGTTTAWREISNRRQRRGPSEDHRGSCSGPPTASSG